MADSKPKGFFKSLAQWFGGGRSLPPLNLPDPGSMGRSPGLPKGQPEFFGPLEPLPPVAPPYVTGRQFDYTFGLNLLYTPRGDQPISFNDLRMLAQNCDLVRMVIETRKDQICKLRWSLSPIGDDKKKPGAEAQKQVQEATALLKRPDKVHTFNQWLRALLEDMLVIDAATIYPRPTRGGGLYALEYIDGATIKPVIDEWGRPPLPPEPAYQQIIKGLPAVDYTREELLYFPRNPLSWRVYGLSPVEQIVITVNIILRRELHLLQYYTDGNLPDALMEVPENWSTAQIAEFQSYWDALFAGNTAQRRRGTWVPRGVNPHFTKEPELKNPLEEWFARKVCYAFSVSPQPFVQIINRATAETAQQAALEEGLAPLMEWVTDLVNLLLQPHFPLIEFSWKEGTAVDLGVQAQIDKSDVSMGIRSIDEVRQDRGLDPVGIGNFVLTTQGPVLVADIGKEPQPQPAPGAPGEEEEEGT